MRSRTVDEQGTMKQGTAVGAEGRGSMWNVTVRLRRRRWMLEAEAVKVVVSCRKKKAKGGRGGWKH